MLLTDFHILRPPHEMAQADTLHWLADAHAESERRKGNPDPAFADQIREKLWHVGCKPDRIAKRGHILSDYLHRDWEKMEVYRLSEAGSGRDLSVRSKHFEEHADLIFEQYYPENSIPPEDLIHVTCTGYISPSGAQKIASKRNWGNKATITHAYHMGCYASIPAIRMAGGFLSYSSEKVRIDIVHTEMCSLHTDPSNHGLGQLVSQSLFADGFIKYSARRTTSGPHLKVLATLEEIIPNSTKAMTWNVSHWGFEISLAKEIPVLIVRALPHFLECLVKKAGADAGADFDDVLSRAYFAVHPGGPKILTHVQELLKLRDEQIAKSFEILKNYGNMSSATLPHIWQAILADPAIPSGTRVVSFAFGPGLSVTGAIMEKICGS
jgi:predicted naringenin-chalcone synthase